MNITNLAVMLIRTLVFLLCQVCFFIMDFCYNIIMEIVSLNLYNFGFIWSWWRGLLGFMFLFIVARLSFMYFKAMYDEDTLEKANPQGIIIRLFVIGFVLLLLPVILEGLSAMTSGLTSNLASIIGVDGATKPSLLFLKGGGVPAGLSASDIDINQKVGEAFKYFPTTVELFFVLITSALGAMMFLFIGLQITQRLFSMMLKVLISPYAVSGIVVENDGTFDTWWKLFVADFLTAFFQVMLIYLIFTGINFVENLSPVAKMIFFMGGLFTIMNAPQGVAQLLGGDIGTATAFQQMQSMQMLGNGINFAGHMATTAAAGAGTLATGVGAAGVYTAGRIMGGASMTGAMLNSVGGDNGTPPISYSSSSGGTGGYSGSSSGGSGLASGGADYSSSSNGASYAGGTGSLGYGGSSGNSVNQYNSYAKTGSWAHQAGWKLNQQGAVGKLANKGFQTLYRASSRKLFQPGRDNRGNVKHTLAGNAARVRNVMRDNRPGGNNV